MVTYTDDLETKEIGAERTAREKTLQSFYRNEFETDVQDPIDQRNPVMDRLRYIANNGKEPEDLRFWAILIIFGALFFLAMIGNR